MVLTRQLQKAAQSVRGRVKGDLVERKVWTRDSVGGRGNRQDAKQARQRTAEGTCARKHRLESKRCVGDGAGHGQRQIPRATLSATQPVRGVTVTKCMFLFPPKNPSCVR